MHFHINSNNIKLLIFDCDGTLVDTMPAHYESWNDVYASLGKNFYPKEAFIRDLGGMSGENTVKTINEKFGYNLEPKETTRKKDHSFLESYIAHVQPITKVIQIAKNYYGKLPMTVASGGSAIIVNKLLKNLGIQELFSHIVTAEDVSKCKPAPDVFIEAANRAGINDYAKCLVFEDGLLGLEAAQRAGMQYVDINTLNNIPIKNENWSWGP